MEFLCKFLEKKNEVCVFFFEAFPWASKTRQNQTTTMHPPPHPSDPSFHIATRESGVCVGWAESCVAATGHSSQGLQRWWRPLWGRDACQGPAGLAAGGLGVGPPDLQHHMGHGRATPSRWQGSLCRFDAWVRGPGLFSRLTFAPKHWCGIGMGIGFWWHHFHGTLFRWWCFFLRVLFLRTA